MRVVDIWANHVSSDGSVVPIAKRFKQSSLLRIIVGHEGNPATDKVRMRPEHSLHDSKHGVWHGDVPFHLPQVAHQRVLGKVQGILNHHGLHGELSLCALFQLVGHHPMEIVELNAGNQLQSDGCENDIQDNLVLQHESHRTECHLISQL